MFGLFDYIWDTIKSNVSISQHFDKLKKMGSQPFPQSTKELDSLMSSLNASEKKSLINALRNCRDLALKENVYAHANYAALYTYASEKWG